jgi:hypothetical protein
MDVVEGIKWLLGKVRDEEYCDVGLILTVHQGRVKKMQKILIQKERPDKDESSDLINRPLY